MRGRNPCGMRNPITLRSHLERHLRSLQWRGITGKYGATDQQRKLSILRSGDQYRMDWLPEPERTVRGCPLLRVLYVLE
jgi:hypothetical protein